jgi:hypothetical protein
MNTPGSLPPEVAARLMECLEEVEGDYRVKDMEGLVTLIVEHGPRYPFLYELVTVNKDALVKHYETTGEVPPGVKLVKTIAEEGSNVVGLSVIHGKPSTR